MEALKLSLIQYIMNLQDIGQLQELYVAIHATDKDSALLKQLNKPMPKTIDIEQLKKEQGFQPIDKTQFFKALDDLNIEESIDRRSSDKTNIAMQ